MVGKKIKRFPISQQEGEITVGSIFDFYLQRSTCTWNKTGFPTLKVPSFILSEE